MRYVWPIVIIVLTVVFVAAGNVRVAATRGASPEGAVNAMFDAVKNRDWDAAFAHVANAGSLDKSDFVADLQGRDGSLRTYAALDGVTANVLQQNGNAALVRANLHYYSAVGALEDTRDLKLVREAQEWKIVWPVEKRPNLPPQVIPVDYLRWDVIYRGAEDDWGAQDAAPPKVRITSMNAIDYGHGTVILGEIVNDDTVPGFIAVNATLLGNQGEVLGEETAFDKILHTLLPKEVSPFRIDFPHVRLAQVKNVRITPNSLLVSASADPVVGAVHQQMSDGPAGRRELKGELVNESGQTVNIPHILATFYDNSGKIVWVSDAYVQQALLPQTPLPFTVSIDSEVAPKMQSYRVAVNEFMLNRQRGE